MIRPIEWRRLNKLGAYDYFTARVPGGERVPVDDPHYKELPCRPSSTPFSSSPSPAPREPSASSAPSST